MKSGKNPDPRKSTYKCCHTTFEPVVPLLQRKYIRERERQRIKGVYCPQPLEDLPRIDALHHQSGRAVG
jgi:hypothetical protein